MTLSMPLLVAAKSHVQKRFNDAAALAAQGGVSFYASTGRSSPSQGFPERGVFSARGRRQAWHELQQTGPPSSDKTGHEPQNSVHQKAKQQRWGGGRRGIGGKLFPPMRSHHPIAVQPPHTSQTGNPDSLATTTKLLSNLSGG